MSKKTSVKLSNGENLICDVLSDSDTTYSRITTQDGNLVKNLQGVCCRITSLEMDTVCDEKIYLNKNNIN